MRLPHVAAAGTAACIAAGLAAQDAGHKHSTATPAVGTPTALGLQRTGAQLCSLLTIAASTYCKHLLSLTVAVTTVFIAPMAPLYSIVTSI